MKGQISIEYLIIFVILLILFTNVSIDLMNSSMESTLSLQKEEMLNTAKILINDAVESMRYQGSGARRTIQLRAPPNCYYTITANQITATCGTDSKLLGPATLPSGVSYTAGRIGGNELAPVQILRS